MTLIAKETIKLGFTVVALPGTRVAKELVDDNGWQDLVEDDGRGEDGEAAPKTRRARKAAAE